MAAAGISSAAREISASDFSGSCENSAGVVFSKRKMVCEKRDSGSSLMENAQKPVRAFSGRFVKDAASVMVGNKCARGTLLLRNEVIGLGN